MGNSSNIFCITAGIPSIKQQLFAKNEKNAIVIQVNFGNPYYPSSIILHYKEKSFFQI